MSDFKRILGYEYLKLFRRKIIWITLGIMILLSAFVICISDIGLNSDGQNIIQYIHENRQKELEIAGKPVVFFVLFITLRPDTDKKYNRR